MPQVYKGPRVLQSVRLPVSEYREVTVRAKRMNMSINDFVLLCIRKYLEDTR